MPSSKALKKHSHPGHGVTDVIRITKKEEKNLLVSVGRSSPPSTAFERFRNSGLILIT